MPVKTHGLSKTSEYKIWHGIKKRCTIPTDPSYRRYGGRGITVCERWRDSFMAFYGDMGPRPSSSHSIDRIDNDGHYEPGNCRWATALEQHRNKSNSRPVTINGMAKTAREWAEQCGIPVSTMQGRIRRGVTGERLLLATYPSDESSTAFQDLTGRRFGRLMAVSHVGKIGGQRAWKFRCDCGTVKVARSALVVNGTTTSCGCVRREMLGNLSRKHGLCDSTEHLAWVRMKGRCYNKKHRDYSLAGARGITVCDRWLHSFEDFLADLGPKPSPGHSLRLQDDTTEYGPETASWGIRLPDLRINGRLTRRS